MSALHVLAAPRAQRGFVAHIAVTDDAIVAVGGTSYEPTALASSTARQFATIDAPASGLRAVVGLDDAVWRCGEFGYLARADGADGEWVQQTLETSGCLFDLAATPEGLYVAGDDGVLLRATPDGVETLDSGTDARVSALGWASGGLWLLGFDGGLRRWADGRCTTVLTPDRALTGLTETAAGTILVSGDGGRIHRSTDAGQTFSAVALDVREDLEDIAALPDGRVVAVGGGGTLLVSDDDGATFRSLATGLSEHPTLWCIAPFGDGALIGGDSGLIAWLGAEDALPWTDRAERFATDASADAHFAGGPDGFLDGRLAAWLESQREEDDEGEDEEADDDDDEDAEAEDGDDDEDEDDDPDAAGEDAWKAAAWAKARTLWTGSTADIPAVFGCDAPPELVAFEAATRGVNPWSTFEELRLDAAQMTEPPEDANLFEMAILSDQLNYLGTALPEAFSGVVCIGSLGNGDTYHLELAPASDGRGRTVLFWSHDDHCFEYTFADSLEPLVYLCARCRAVDEEHVSDDVAAAGFAALHGRVAPSWHFGIDDRDADFEPYEHPADSRMTEFLFWRSSWLMRLFRQDGIVGVEDLPNHFHPGLNTVLAEEHIPARMEAARKLAPTALYAMWRAYLFDEPELDAYLEIGRAHAGRIVRDAAALIDELRAGTRTAIGRIDDWPRLLERFRALDLDPRRAAEREAEAAAEAERRAAEAAELLEAFDGLDAAAQEAFAWTHWDKAAIRAGLAERIVPRNPQANRALVYLRDQGYSRNNQLYRDEEYSACAWVADHADGPLQALLVGEALAAAPREEDEPARLVNHVWDILPRLARAGRLDPRALPLLRAHVAAADFEDDVPWTVRRVIPILAEAGDTESGPAIASILADIPAEGGFETSLKWDDFVGEIADALRTLGDPAHAEPLLRFASSPALRMRDARTGAARAVADLAPEHGTEPMLMNLVEMTARINDSEENSAALLAVAKCAPRLDDDARGRLRATLDGTEPMALNYEEVELARALALRATGAEADVAAAMEGCLTKPGWKEEYTVRRRRFALETLALEPVEPERLLPFLEMRDPALTAETLAALAALGHPAEAARTLTWFEVEDMGGAQVMAAALDPALGGRHQAIRALASHGEAARDTLETVARGALDRAPENPSGDLTEADGRMLREAVRALLQLPEAESTTSLWDVMLRHPNRDAKWEILQDPPAIAALADAMRVVAAEKWGWQETTARRWLDAHG